MTLALRLGLRNVLRYARRSLITAGTIAASFAMLVLAIGISEGSYASIVDNAARSGAGHVVVRAPGYDPLDPVPLADAAAVLVAAARHGLAVPRAEALVVASASSGSATLLALGVDPLIEEQASITAEALVEGAWLPEEPGRVGKALVGRSLAKRLRVDVGDRLVVTANSPDQALLFRVGGLFSTGSPAVDDGLVLVDRRALSTLLGEPDVVHSVGVLLDDVYDAARVAEELGAALPHAQVLTWAEALPEVGDYITLDRTSASAMFFVLFFLVGLAILNSILMSVFERKRELGVLLALGTAPRTLFTMVVIEGVMLSVVSVALGLAIGWAGVSYLAVDGLDLSALMGSDYDLAGYAMEPVIYPLIKVGRVIDGVVMVVLLTLLAALYPAWKAARVPPVEAISRL